MDELPDFLYDYLFNETNESSDGLYDHSELPGRQWSDYAEITFLSVMLLVGVPLNVISISRSWRSRNPGRRNNRSDTTSGGRNLLSTLSTISRGATGSVRSTNRNNNSVSQFKTLQIHLTVANLMIICIYGLSQICWLITIEWRGGDFGCRLVKFVHTFCFYATSNMVAMIAIDRLCVTIHIDRQRMHSSAVRCLNAATLIAWLLACASSLPQAFFWRAYAPFPDSPTWHQCVTVWVANRHRSQLIHMSLLEDRLYNESYMNTVQSYIVLNTSMTPNLVIIPDQPSFYEDLYGGVHLALVFWFPALIVITSYSVIVGKFHKKINQTNRETTRRRRFVQQKEAAQFRQKLSKWHQRSPVSEELSSKMITSDHDNNTVINTGQDEESRNRVINGDQMEELRKTEDSIPCSTKMIGLPIILHSSRAMALRRVSRDVTVTTLTRAKRTTLKKTMWILLAYVVCWSPYNVLELWRYFDTMFENSYLEFLSNLIVLNAVLNPLIYSI